MASDGPIILFDGVCSLCNFAVRFILARDSRERLRFAPLQSEEARPLLERCGLDPDALDTLVLVKRDGSCSTRSTGALEIARRLDWPWPLLYPLILLPAFLRDPLYRLVARHRYRWFGTLDQGFEPDPEARHRFLGQDGGTGGGDGGGED